MTKILPPQKACAMCRALDWHFEASFKSRPEGETDFALEPYYRELWRCRNCGHVVNHHEMDISALYSSAYWDNTYADKIRATYDRILALPTDRSDNRARVAAIIGYWSMAATDLPKTLLDVGSGLAVFPAAMREEGWVCTALDPDPRAVAHAEEVAQVRGLAADFMTADINQKFSLVTMNKVLEHVTDMVGMLRRAHDLLLPGGLVYIELPDGEGALQDSPAREEFFIEHYCAFSMASLAHMVRQTGFRCDRIDRLREPSGKYTLRAFLRCAS